MLYWSGTKYPTRQRGHSEGYLLGGAHLTYYTFLPFFLLKLLSQTECGKDGSGRMGRRMIREAFTIPLKMENSSLTYMEKYHHQRNKDKRIRLLKDIPDDLSNIVNVPWFYACNPSRYPSWEGKHDSRVS